jgi:hypothetical protein
LHFESKLLKPVSHLIGSRVETSRFQAMGQLNSTGARPTSASASLSSTLFSLGAAVQVDPFERQSLKPEQHFIGSRVGSPGAFKLRVSTEFNLYSPPPRALGGEPRAELPHPHRLTVAAAKTTAQVITPGSQGCQSGDGDGDGGGGSRLRVGLGQTGHRRRWSLSTLGLNKRAFLPSLPSHPPTRDTPSARG